MNAVTPKDTPRYTISAIVSVYKAERFLKACLNDLGAQRIFSQTEVIIIDANSPEIEGAIAETYTRQYPNIIYYRTQERETLYASWNRGIHMAQGKYITNANADARHAPHAFERLAAELDTHPHVALVYPDCRVTHEENALFASAPIAGYLRRLPYDYLNLLRHCEVGPQPMWRKSVHEKAGFFDASYRVAGDYDMWLRMAEHAPFRHVPEELGLYLHYDNNLESQNLTQTHQERMRAQNRAMQYFMQDNFVPEVPFVQQIAVHKQRLARYLHNMENGATIKNTNKLAFHVYAYILLCAKCNTENADMLKLGERIATLPNNVDAAYLRDLLQLV